MSLFLVCRQLSCIKKLAMIQHSPTLLQKYFQRWNQLVVEDVQVPYCIYLQSRHELGEYRITSIIFYCCFLNFFHIFSLSLEDGNGVKAIHLVCGVFIIGHTYPYLQFYISAVCIRIGQSSLKPSRTEPQTLTNGNPFLTC